MATARRSRRGGRRGGRSRARSLTEAPPPPVDLVLEADPIDQPIEAAPVEHSLDDLPLATPEPGLAARVPQPEPPRPLPSGRRAIFFDVENTSRAEHIARVISHLAVDRAGRRTEFFAVGNWRVIGHDTARLLARHGAALVHSAPSVGVRDWSDLRIAVGSGVWLAGARPGDVIEIVSDDRAFDAVGDVAASLGVTFRRLSYRGLLASGSPVPVAVEPVAEREYDQDDRGGRHGRRRRGGRGRGDRGDRGDRGGRPPMHHAPAIQHAPRPEPVGAEEPHTAPHDEIVAVVQDLMRSRGAVTLDSLANALKSRGFSRPPGSPRLITRLRRIKELEVNRAGVITLVGAAATAPAAAPSEPEPDSEREREPEPVAYDAEPAAEPPAEAVEPVAAAGEASQEHEEEGPDPGNREGAHLQTASAGGDRGGRRRSRRGGRRRRGRDGGRGGEGGREGGYGGGGGREGGGGPPRSAPPAPPRSTGADRARDVASRYAPRDVAPSWISGQPLA